MEIRPRGVGWWGVGGAVPRVKRQKLQNEYKPQIDIVCSDDQVLSGYTAS